MRCSPVAPENSEIKVQIQIASDCCYYWSDSCYIPVGSVVKTESETLIPDEYALWHNYPNPFNPVTTISYELPQISDVTLKIYDITCRLIEAVVSEKQDPRYYSFQWEASDVSSGVYIYRIQTDGFSAVKKCILMK